jgi:hypothetical protein
MIRHVDAQVDHAVSSAFQHHDHQIFADIVHVALDGADDDDLDHADLHLQEVARCPSSPCQVYE